MKTVRILRRAQTDLEEIKRYIERDSPRRAEKFVSKLLDRIESGPLFQMPASFPVTKCFAREAFWF